MFIHRKYFFSLKEKKWQFESAFQDSILSIRVTQYDKMIRFIYCIIFEKKTSFKCDPTDLEINDEITLDATLFLLCCNHRNTWQTWWSKDFEKLLPFKIKYTFWNHFKKWLLSLKIVQRNSKIGQFLFLSGDLSVLFNLSKIYDTIIWLKCNACLMACLLASIPHLFVILMIIAEIQPTMDVLRTVREKTWHRVIKVSFQTYS